MKSVKFDYINNGKQYIYNLAHRNILLNYEEFGICRNDKKRKCLATQSVHATEIEIHVQMMLITK